MTYTEFWTGIGDFFTATFQFMKPIGNAYNYPFWVLIFCLLAFWTNRMLKQSKDAKKNGTLI
jgi:hypothetical protein